MTNLFQQQIPLHEVYIGSKYDRYVESEEEGEYEYGENGEYEEYKYGSFESLMNNISAKKKNFKLDKISIDIDKRKALLSLLSFTDSENTIFNNFYNKILSKHKHSEYSDLRGMYTSNVSIALPYFLPEFSRFNFNYWYGDDILPELYNSNTQYFAYLFHRIDRSPQILKWMWKAWKETIFNNIDTKTYFDKSFHDYTEGLIIMYDTIKKIENYEDVLKEAYHYRATHTNEYTYDMPPESLHYYENDLKIDWNWAPGFWIRRFHEGNHELVLEILIEIKDHYAGNELDYLVQERLDKDIVKEASVSLF